MRFRRLTLTSVGFTISSAAIAQTITPVVTEGDPVAGAGLVTTISGLAVNDSGLWLVEADTDAATTIDTVVFRGAALFLHEDEPLTPAPATLSSVDGFSINSAGDVGSNLFLRNLTTSTDSGVYFNTSLVLQEGTLSTSAQFSPNTPYIGWFDARINDNDKILMLASVDDPAIALTVNRAIVIANVSSSGVLLSEDVLFKQGDTLPGFGAETLTDVSTGPHSIAFNNANTAIFIADMTGAMATDAAIVIGNTGGLTVVAREGDPSPIAGRNYETLLGKSLDINDTGHWASAANLDGASTDDEVIVKDNNQIVAQEGTVPPGITGFTLIGLGTGAVRIDNAGNVFWFGVWNDPDTTRDRGLFRNNQLIAQEGVTLVGGVPLEYISNAQDNFSISPDGRYLIFEGRLPGAIDAAFLVDFGGSTATPFCFGDGTATACPCGNQGVAGNGCASSVNAGGAHLAASGSASISSDTLLLTSTGLPNSPALYFQGTTRVAGGAGSVFGDGLRCAGGTVVRLGTVFAASGTSTFPDVGHPSISVKGVVTAPGMRTYQAWYRNAAAFCTPSTFNLTNGIELTWIN